LSAIRADVHMDFTVFFTNTYGNEVGWHFSWMGSNEDRLLKSESFCHANQKLKQLEHKRYSNQKTKDDMLEYDMSTSQCPSGDITYIMKEYPCEELPQIIFDLPRVKEFLLPE